MSERETPQAPSIHADPATIDTYVAHLQLEQQRLFETLGFACTEHRATMADQFGTDVVDMDKMKGLK